MQKRGSEGYHVRIDPILVNRFKRLPAGVNEAGIKIVRDFGLKYAYDKKTDTFEIIGDDPEILHIAIETLRFWVEEDDYPSTGITCQVGYPNKGIIIWRFHGDYAKKFNHLFTDDITKLKRVPSLYVKAVPTKRNPEYVELFCNFLVYPQVKGELSRISAEMEKIFQTDFFVPRSDFNKARDFARSKGRDVKVLYALKEYPENNKIRVWIFARDNQEIIRAKREWIQHVGMIARDNKLVQEEKTHGVDMNTAVYFGHPSSAITSERSSPLNRQKPDTSRQMDNQGSQASQNITNTQSNLKRKTSTSTDLAKTSPRSQKYDHSNYPRPHDFVYPITWDETGKEFYKFNEERLTDDNPFNLDKMENLSTIDEAGTMQTQQNAVAINPLAGEARWVRDDEIVKTGRKIPKKTGTNRVYVHLQVNNKSLHPSFGQSPAKAVKVFHPEKNLIPISKLNAKNVISSVTDPTLAPGVKRRGKNVRPGGKKVEKKPLKIAGSTRVLKPILQDQMPVSNIRYQIKVNGLAIYMYKHFIVKLDNMDALVNTVSTSLRNGGLIAESMFEHAGEGVVDEVEIYLKMYGPLKIGQNLVTSAGQIPAMGIIHVAAPIWEVYSNIPEEECVMDLHKTIYDALKTAEKHKYRKVGLPVISAEPYFGVPQQIVADVYVKALVDYSLAMGPLYPVLEIHIVDMDVDLLNSIKESYEKWASSPAFKNVKTEFASRENSLTSPTQLSHRAQSAVSLKGARSHKSQNMVTFMEQSYTEEGNQMWTFEVLKKLLVHVYTGTLLNVEGVEGLVCGTDTNLKGALAKQFLIYGGPNYERALRFARGKKPLEEGDVIVCEGGELSGDLILHSIVSSPIYRVSRKNLARLDNINNEVLHTANQLDIRTLALPLIGTARLREGFEVEQCSLQLVDNIIEFCLSMEKNLRIKELHLVNVNNTTTQCLTQALRTRAHTKLRVEVSSEPTSRQEVLSTTGNKQVSDMQLQSLDFQDTITPRDPQEPYQDNMFASGQLVNAENGAIIDSSSRNVHIQSRKRVAYLSEKNLKEHEQSLKEQEPPKENNEILNVNEKKGNAEHDMKPKAPVNASKPKPKLSKPERPTFLKYTEGKADDPPYLPRLDLGETQNSTDAIKTKRVKQRTPVRGPILQKSRAESYKEIHERRKSFITQRQNELARLRRTRSTDNALFSKENADKVYEMFKLERHKIQTLRAFNNRMGSHENSAEDLMQKYSNYFTRGTRERYRINAGHNIDDKDFEMTYKVDPEATINDMITSRKDVQNAKTERELKPVEFADRNMNSRFKMGDRKKDREERYMMDMDFGRVDTDGQPQTHRQGSQGAHPADGYDGDNLPLTVQDQSHRPFTDRSELSKKKKQERYEDLTVEGGNGMLDFPGQTSFENENQRRTEPNRDDGADFLNESRDMQQDLNEEKNEQTNWAGQSDKNSKLIEQFDQYVLETDYPNQDHIDAIAASFDQYVTDPNTKEDSSKNGAGKNVKGKLVKTGKGPERRPNKGPIVKSKTSNIPKFHGLKKTSVDSKQDSLTSRTAPNPTNMDRDDPNLNYMYPEIPVAPKSDDVTIRDKLTLEIDVLNKKDLESDKMKKEKKKIRRFWEVVDDSKELNDKEIYGEQNLPNEKVVVAKVKKERKMSARSKASKSNVSAVTQPIGKYNVTVEVA